MTKAVTSSNEAEASVSRVSGVPGLIRAARTADELSMRELARRSDLSVAQISRIEAGAVGDSALETLTSIATGLRRDPQLLVIAAGRVPRDEATQVVREAVLAVSSDASWTKTVDALDRAIAATQKADENVVAAEQEVLAATREWDRLQVERQEIEWSLRVVPQSLFEASIRRKRDDPGTPDKEREVQSLLREQAKVMEELEVERKRLDVLKRRVVDLRTGAEDASRKLEETVRELAGQLFLRGVWAPPLGIGSAATGTPESRAALPYLQNNSLWLSAAINGRLSDSLTYFTGEPDGDFRDLLFGWPRLTPERKKKVLEFFDDQQRLSIQEQLDEERREVVDAGDPSPAKRRRK